MHHENYVDDELSETTVARGVFWLALLGVLPGLPFLFIHNAPDWVVIPALSFAVPSAFAAVVSGIEYMLRRRRRVAR